MKSAKGQLESVGGGAGAASGSQSQDSNWVLKCKWGLLAFQSKLKMIMRERNRNIETHCGRSVDGCGSVFPAVTRRRQQRNDLCVRVAMAPS